ncbi:uncharacterized protein LOC112436010 isoform X6 [Maylandia zebra]|uniref:uncharacterized protein LOC112436010 isoform X6 n=2 Tax=Maylandia zebra TaxID=106582 RepID=UPI000D310857|nr:uncharacterized protein LOC112436010 isoform X1 [Maylandia zebra]
MDLNMDISIYNKKYRAPATRPPPSYKTACKPCKMPRKNKRSQAQKKRWKPLDLVDPAVPMLTGHNQDEVVSSFPSDQQIAPARLSLETQDRPTSLCSPGIKTAPARLSLVTENRPTSLCPPGSKTQQNTSLYVVRSLLQQKRDLHVFATEHALPATLTAHQWELIDKTADVLSSIEELTRNVNRKTAPDGIPAITDVFCPVKAVEKLYTDVETVPLF